MKILKTASGKRTLKLSKKEWEVIGKKAGWKVSQAPVDMSDREKINQLGGLIGRARQALAAIHPIALNIENGRIQEMQYQQALENIARQMFRISNLAEADGTILSPDGAEFRTVNTGLATVENAYETLNATPNTQNAQLLAQATQAFGQELAEYWSRISGDDLERLIQN